MLRSSLLEPDPVSTGVGKRNTIWHIEFMSMYYVFHAVILLSQRRIVLFFTVYVMSEILSKNAFAYAMALLVAPYILSAQHPSIPKVTRKQADSARVYQTPSVTVTSTRAAVRETPATFTEISGVDIRNRYTLQDLPALLGEMPSTLFYSDDGSNTGYTTLIMRGFDQRRIAVLVNGVPQNDPEDHNVYWIDFPDMAANLQSVQVQRGAGMVNYGAAAVGGSISLTTANFANAAFARFSGGINWAQYDDGSTRFIPITNRMSAEVSSGLVGNYAMYARLSQINSIGYRDRSWSELGSYFLSAVRFDDKITTQINLYGGPLADGLAYNGLPKSAITNPFLRRANYNYFEYDADSLAVGREVVGYAAPRRAQEIENFSQPHYEILNDANISDNLILKSTLFYYTGDGFFDFDGSWADTNTLRLVSQYGFHPAGNPRNAIIRAAVSNRHGGWVPRIIWQHDNGEFTAGAEVRFHRSNHYGQIRYAELLPKNFDNDYKFYEYNGIRDIYSTFAREQYDLSDNIKLTGEFQIVHHRYAVDNEKAGGKYTAYENFSGEVTGVGSEIFSVNYTFFNPRLGINFNPEGALSGYAAFAVTSREPRMKNLYAAGDSYFGATPKFAAKQVGSTTQYDFTAPLVKPERLTNVEAGARYSKNGIYMNLGIYLMEFSDELVKNGKLDVFGVPVDGNAERSRHIGLEFEAGATISDIHSSGSLTLSGNAAVSRNRFVKYSFFADNGKAIILDDYTIAGFPDVLANIRADYANGVFRAGIALRHIGKMYTDNFGDNLAEIRRNLPGITDYSDNVIPAATVVNFDCSVEFPNILELRKLRLRLAANNLFNLLYAAGGTGKEFFPAAGRTVFLGVEAEL